MESVCHQFIRGKKWKPSSDDIEDHENFGFYLKRWRRRNIRDVLSKQDSFPKTDLAFSDSEEPSALPGSNIDMFHSDGFSTDDPEWHHPTRGKRAHSRTKQRKRSTRRPRESLFANNGWTYNLKNFYNDDLEYEELQTMYGFVSDDDDFDERMGHFTGRAHPNRKSKTSKQDGNKAPPISRESATHRQVLGLPADTLITAKDLKEAFYKCALQWHPDRHDEAEKANAESKFKQAQAAYQALQSQLQ